MPEIKKSTSESVGPEMEWFKQRFDEVADIALDAVRQACAAREKVDELEKHIENDVDVFCEDIEQRVEVLEEKVDESSDK